MKKIAFVLLMMLSSNFVYANDIYIEQAGDDSTIDLIQDGTGNIMGDQLSPLFFGGGSNAVLIEQIGSNNTFNAVVNGASTNTTVSTTGSGNTQSIACGSVSSAGCSGSTITQTILGDNNAITQSLGTGANHTSNISVTGDANTVTHTSTSGGTTAANINVTGSTNTIGVTQSGLTSQSVNVNSSGNNNAITINQSN